MVNLFLYHNFVLQTLNYLKKLDIIYLNNFIRWIVNNNIAY